MDQKQSGSRKHAGIGPTTVLPPDVAKLHRDRDELLAALKKAADDLEATEREWCRSEGQEYDGPSDELTAARAIIAKHC
jgi:hypothetical protein